MGKTKGRRQGSIREKRPGLWEYSAAAPMNPATGRRPRKWGTVRGGRRDAERALAQLIADLHSGAVIVGAGTVGEVLMQWWDTMRLYRWEDATSIRAKQDIDVHLMPALGHIKLEALKPMHLNQLYASLTERGRSPRTVQSVHVTIRAALKYAVQQGLLARNHAEAAVVPIKRRTVRQLPTMQELAKILDAAAGDPLWHAFLRISFHTGARPAEVCALRWNDIDFDRASIRYDEAIGRELHKDGTIGWHLKGTKTHSRTSTGVRTVSADLGTMTVLRRWKTSQQQLLLEVGEFLADDLFIFPADRFGWRPLTPATPSRRFKRYATDAGLDPTIRLYDAARHHHISWALQMGFPVAEVATRVGNTPATVFQTYAHLLPGQDRRIADALEQEWAAR